MVIMEIMLTNMSIQVWMNFPKTFVNNTYEGKHVSLYTKK